jgi:hypothetical protein
MKRLLAVGVAFVSGLLLGLYVLRASKASAQIPQAGVEPPHLTGELLLSSCTDAIHYKEIPELNFEEAVKISNCTGYVRGFLDAVNMTQTAMMAPGRNRSAPKPEVCFPDVSARQGILVLLKYLSDHPERLNERASLLMWAAVKQAWPCSAQ